MRLALSSAGRSLCRSRIPSRLRPSLRTLREPRSGRPARAGALHLFVEGHGIALCRVGEIATDQHQLQRRIAEGRPPSEMGVYRNSAALVDQLEWDDGNVRKNERHGVSAGEAEEVFFSTSLLLLDD